MAAAVVADTLSGTTQMSGGATTLLAPPFSGSHRGKQVMARGRPVTAAAPGCRHGFSLECYMQHQCCIPDVCKERRDLT